MRFSCRGRATLGGAGLPACLLCLHCNNGPKQARDILNKHTNTLYPPCDPPVPPLAHTCVCVPPFEGSDEKFQTRFNKIQFVAHFNAFR